MTPAQTRLLNRVVSGIMLWALLMSAVAPAAQFYIARAQEATEEATDEPIITEEIITETPTETPAEEPTEEVTETPVVEVTEEATVEVTPQETAEPTTEPTVAPTQPPVTDLFRADFQNGDTSGWLLSPGWQLTTEGDNTFLSAATPNETATIAALDWVHFLLAAQVRISPDSQLQAAFRAGAENYTITLAPDGQASLTRAGSLLAQGAPVPSAEDDPAAPWHTLNVQALGDTITVAVDGVVQFSYTDPAPLGTGMIVFSSASENIGAVAFDDVVINRLDEPTATPAATETPAVTEEATAEVTEAPTEEATPDPTPASVLPILTANFEGAADGWALSGGAEIVAAGENNQALRLIAGSGLAPAEALYLADLRMDARFQLSSENAGALEFTFRAQEANYLLAVQAEAIALYRVNGAEQVELAAAPAAYAADVWHDLSLSAQGGQISILVNGAEALTYADETPLLNGQIAFSASGDVLLDNIVLIDLAPLTAVDPTPVPQGLTEADRSKLQSVVYEIVSLRLSGELDGANTLAEENFIQFDNQGRAELIVRAAEGESGQSITPLVEGVGGVIDFTHDRYVAARIPLDSIPALVASPAVVAIVLPDRATSTGNADAPAFVGTGSVLPHSLDILGVNDWFEAGITGSGVNIAVIDTGFQGASGGEYSCLSNNPGNGSGSHGAKVVEVICDIAPGSNVRGFVANNTNQLITHINNARANNRVIVIPMDMGVHLGPGDGTDGNNNNNPNNSVYDAIRAARNAGVLVIVSAGNNNAGRYKSWQHNGGVATFEIHAAAGDTVSLSWNDWDSVPNDDGTREDFELAISGGASISRMGGDPGLQLSFSSSGTFIVHVTKTAGNSDSDYLQLQTTGIISSASVGPTNTTSTLGRPGDSLDALTVGAVCASQQTGYPIMGDSSRGPLYAAGGNPAPAVPGNDRATVKPDLVGPSHVRVSGEPNIVDSCNTLADGFNGTSASAAHVAGMAALLISNPNNSMNAFDAGNGAANALQNYMQTHSIGLVASNSSNGFDNVYGAGLAVLGNPNYDLGEISKPPELNGLPGTTRYVGGRGLGAANNPVQNGSYANPYVSLARALSASSAGDSIVLFPGEYVSGIEISVGAGLYAYNTIGSGNDSVFWVNGTFEGRSGLFVTANNAIIDGFTFMQANPIGTFFGPAGEAWKRPTAVEFNGVSGGELRNSILNGFSGAIPVTVSESSGVTILRNEFEGNRAVSEITATVYILNSSSPGSANPIVVRENHFIENVGSTNVPQELEGVLTIEESAANLIANFFYNNNAEAIVRVSNCFADSGQPNPCSGAQTDARMVNLYSNLFLSNNFGPVVHLKPGERFRFVNNTVVNNTRNAGALNHHRALINRDDPDDVLGWRPNGFDGTWDVHNNLFYSNNNFTNVIEDRAVNSFCRSATLGGGANNTGMSNNWIFGSGSVLNSAADCGPAIANGSNQPINGHLTTNPNPHFIGVANPDLEFLPTDPNYYRLVADAPGVDAGNGAAPNSSVDFTGVNDRVTDGVPDIGAFELVPLQAEPVTVNRAEDTFNQLGDIPAVPAAGQQPYVTGAFAINLADAVIGGLPPYSFSVKSYPANYSTDPNDHCGGLGVVVEGSTAFYCPPQHFYNSGTPFGAVDDVVFEFRAVDITGGEGDFDTVTVNITPVNDQLLNPANSVSYSFVTEVDDPVSFRLRPYVRFSNFRFSESGGGARSNQADYPFDYGNVTVLTEPGDNPQLFGATRAASQSYLNTQVNNAAADGLITITPQPGELGFLSFTYTVTDSRGGSVTNTIRIEVVGILPDRGLHDDTSINFTYTGNWSPLYSEGNINNTLHQSQKVNDKAAFTFVGEGFTLYMQSDPRGGNWQLRVDEQLLNWTRDGGESRATADGIRCSTRATTSGSNISNKDRTKALYTITCRDMRDGESHTIEIVNRENRKRLNVDAISINFDGDPIRPGIHEVNEALILPYFPQWSFVNDKKASNGVALRTNQTGEVRFAFTGTGLSIGTGLAANGATYDICITPEDGVEVCSSFNNRTGAKGRKTTWGVFRSFFGFDPTRRHNVRLIVKNVPAGGNMVIDSITVFRDQPTAPLPFGSTENDEIGPIIFGNGQDDSWVFDANKRNASNNSLHSVAKKTAHIGPFISFQIPADANKLLWYRVSGKKDSTQVMVCVDRAQGETAANHCRQFNLTNAPNPLPILESAYTGGWGDGFGANNTHTVEIFSMVNSPFNFDRIQVFNTTTPLSPSYYEETALDGNNVVYGHFNSSGNPNSGPFNNVNDKKASGKSVKRTSQNGAGVFFQMTGTGFAALFTQNKNAGNVEICWVNGHTSDIAAIRAGTCRTINNNSKRPVYMAGRAIIGLSDTPQDFSVTVRNNNGTMDFDALEIFGDMPGVALTGDGRRYQTSYVNRLADDQFLYVGSGWVTRSNNKATDGYQDEINKRLGAGIVFHTNGVNTVEIIRTPGKKNARLEVCVDGGNCRSFAGDANPVIAHLPDTNPHQISVITTTAGKFILDAVHVYEDRTLTPGSYEDTHPFLGFDGTWNAVKGKGYSANSAKQSNGNNATLLFHFNGSSFQIGAQATAANQMQVCYVAGIVTNANSVGDNCQTWPPTAGNAVQVYTRNIGGAPADYTVRVRRTGGGNLTVDYVNIVDATGALQEGRYEETFPVVDDGFNGTWTSLTGKGYSGGSVAQTATANDTLIFEFEGTGFEIGTIVDSAGGNMQVCYEAGSIATPDEHCYTYNNNGRTNTTVSRSVNGLADGLYSVRVVNISGTLKIDFVGIFEATPPAVSVGAEGTHNESALAEPGLPYLTLLPANHWLTVSGKKAKNFSGSSYATVVDARGRASNKQVGAIATLRVEVPAGEETIVVLDTGPTSNKNSTGLLICVENVSGAGNACQVRNMRTSRYHTVTINNGTGSNFTRSITLRTITDGSFNLDGFHVVSSTVLAEGLYDDTLMTNGGIINVSNNWTGGVKNKRAYGGTVIRTRANNATMEFDFNGSGFSIITHQNNRGINFQLCYVLESQFTAWGSSPGETCRNLSTDIAKGKVDRYGHTVYGLAPDTYKVRLRVNDGSIANKDFLQVDAVAIFGDVTSGTALQPGLYDDTELAATFAEAVRFAPAVFWDVTLAKRNPPKGPWQLTDRWTQYSGATMQVFVEGNALTIYQAVAKKNSKDVRVCLVVPLAEGNELECTNFSQNGKTTYFTPILIYGLGDGEHEVIFENRDTRRFNVDALQVIP